MTWVFHLCLLMRYCWIRDLLGLFVWFPATKLESQITNLTRAQDHLIEYLEKCDGTSIRYHVSLSQSALVQVAAMKNPNKKRAKLSNAMLRGRHFTITYNRL